MYLYFTDYTPGENFDLKEISSKIASLKTPLAKKSLYVLERLHYWRKTGQMENSWEMGTSEELEINGRKVLTFSDDEGLNYMAAFFELRTIYPKIFSDIGFRVIADD